MTDLFFQTPPRLENEKIKLIPMEFDHAKPLFAINSSNHWAYMLTVVDTEKEMQEWVMTGIKEREQNISLPFVVILKDSNQVVGTTKMNLINFAQKSCEIGSTWYGADFQRTFVNTDCKLLLLSYCFEELQMIRVQLKTDERNLRSQKAIERLGAVKEGILRNERILANGYIRNAVLYSITNQEWPNVKRKLIEKRNSYSN
ncbi:GNAT family N-acetyltransferase [Heyndrickxia oleronia]|uniref:GNAT family N-acetyltransferase n=1 Tax=Heyndrickxia oleronia TaxID=38875 RepID=UPI00203AD2B5|nr:GNAT family protein [Heyndrickxia oleronia]MCM3238966.1 GNAT family N-acetyltransferase [Heyndrickxia oleronia]